jgi:deoxycytidylate deaminase
VVPDIGCNKEIIQNEVNGFLYKKNSQVDLTKVLKKILFLKESVRDTIEMNAITTAEELTNTKKNIKDILNFVLQE